LIPIRAGLPSFEPLTTNPHLQTILGHWWPRRFDVRRYPVECRLVRTEPDVQVLVETQRPAGTSLGHFVLLHGLESSSRAGYMLSLAQAAVEAGFTAHRLNTRTCGGTEQLCNTLYHAGLTNDLLAFLRMLERDGNTPAWLAGFSLGGNVVLKLAGELAEEGSRLIAGACAVSTPIDLAVCARRIADPENALYQARFIRQMRARLRRSGRDASTCGTLYDIDDRLTAPSFGFENAAHYYATQSAVRFLDRIRVPVLLIQADDDTMVPAEMFAHPSVHSNPCIELFITPHGGHVGFLARRRPRLWLDSAVLAWVAVQRNKRSEMLAYN
jgi:predicted alpha/beta-fold hydrolase